MVDVKAKKKKRKVGIRAIGLCTGMFSCVGGRLGAPPSAEEVRSLELGVFGAHTLMDIPGHITVGRHF